MIVVSNTTPLIGLATIQRFDLLRQIFGEIVIPQAVSDEAVIKGRDEGGAKHEVTTATWIKTAQVHDRLAVDVLLDELDLGEAETIVLAREVSAAWVSMDEKKGRRKLAELGIKKIGTVGILLRAKKIGLITAVRPEIELLRQKGFSTSQDVVDAVIRQANE